MRHHFTAVIMTRLASGTAALTAVSIVGWPAAITGISLVAAVTLLTVWVLRSSERTRQLVNVISAMRSERALPSSDDAHHPGGEP